MNLRRLAVASSMAMLLLPSPALLFSAEEPAPPVIKGAPKAESKAQDQPKESKPPEGKPPDAKAPDAKPEPRAAEPNKKAKEAEHKAQEPNGAPGGSPILAVKLALMADSRLFPYEIEVDLKDQDATLSGAVSSEEEKAAATEIAQRVEGIKSVANRLRIVKDLPQALSHRRDELISQHVKERFKKSRTLESAGFDVKTEDGVVSLSGRTRFQVIVLEAAEAARQVPGVKAVRTELVRLEAGDDHR